MILRLLQNHVLANLIFALVLMVGILSYLIMPREQDPTINFNWIDITTIFPGASAQDVEKRITDVLEDAVRKLPDVRFVSSSSRESTSNIVVRFEDIGAREFDKRVTDLRREIQNKQAELPDAALDPVVFEVTSANAFPTATVIVSGQANDEILRAQSERIRKDLERIKGVDRVLFTALPDPELQVLFDPQRLEQFNLQPTQISDTIRLHFKDVAAGSVQAEGESWLVRLLGTNSDPAYLAEIPIVGDDGEIELGRVASIQRGREKARRLVRYNGKPAVMLAVTKQADQNILQVVERVRDYVDERNQLREATAVQVSLADDQTQITLDALRIMQVNASLGLLFVLIVTWIFVGGRIAFLTSIGIPFILAGTFWILRSADQTLNVSVLLGVVISLGMLVDDAVVVVEAIYYRLQRGVAVVSATVGALKEVAAPVTTSVLTTMAAFLPLMLLPGILGQFMLVIPLVVTIALAISLVEAFWMLPVHIVGMNVRFNSASRAHRIRVRFLAWLRRRYTGALIRVLRHPFLTLAAVIALLIFSATALIQEKIKFDFFASDPVRLFYVNIEMPVGTPLNSTLEKVLQVENKVRSHVEPGESRAIVSYAGQMFTDIAPFFGDQYGQILVSLPPKNDDIRSVDDLIESMRVDVENTPGADKISFLRLAGGPPTSKAISIKVRGDQFEDIRAAADDLKEIMAATDGIRDIVDDDTPGQLEFNLTIDLPAAQRAGISPNLIAQTLQLLVDGQVVASMQDKGEELDVRIQSNSASFNSIDQLLDLTLPNAKGDRVPLASLLHQSADRGPATIRHYNFRRAITVEADIDKLITDTVAANDAVLEQWSQVRNNHPNIDLDFSGVLDDIQESLDAIGILFLFGVGLMFLILGTQFRSYFQPLMILVSVVLAFTGVVLGLLVTQNPLSLFTLYGIVALAGISVNAAIVLISAANDRLAAGMSLLHATLYAGRRRVVPILITSLTTIAGLFSLATGLGGHSLLWGPIATSIVWGLAFSTVLTLFVVPLLYRLFMGWSHRVQRH